MTSAIYGIGLLLLFVILRVSHRFDVGVDRDEDDAASGPQFELEASNPESRTMFRFLAMLALLSLGATVMLFEVVSPIQAIAPVIITCPLALVGNWRFSRHFRGRAELGSGGIDVRAAGRTVRLRWEHIRAIDVTTFGRSGGGDAVFAALMYAGVDEPFVRLKLNRSLRLDAFAGLTGPAVAGLPTGIRQIRIWLANPETFVQLAQPYLSVAAPALRATANAQPSSPV